MKFLEEIADVVLGLPEKEGQDVTVIFPNRRAGLFFQKYLAEKTASPIWSPKITSIEDFIKNLSELRTADKLDLVFELYRVFIRLNKSNEKFDKFFFWGNIMLQDFDELDHFLADPELLFKNLIQIKNLENNIDYLDEEQQKLIKNFWLSFGEKHSTHQKGFLAIWNNMLETYVQFKKRLIEKGIAYNGMIYREVHDGLLGGTLKPNTGMMIFAGFNALSKSEEAIISWFVKEGIGKVYWDADDYYLQDKNQEAGKFLRELKYGNAVLRASFSENYGNAFKDEAKKIEVINVASDIGQAQKASALLSTWGTTFDEQTAVVLPDSKLLFPLLTALPPEVDRLNITMGYPLSSSTAFGFLDALINLQIRSAGKQSYHFRTILAILRHPLLTKTKDEHFVAIEADIINKNTIWVAKKLLHSRHPMLNFIFAPPEDSISAYLMEVVKLLSEQSDEEVEKEILFHFYKLLNKINEFVLINKQELSLAAYQKLFRQLVQAERLPFEGEPLLGLQVMGILETRNLDFDNVIMLSTNEGLLPPAPKSHTFLPYSIRKVFELPIIDHQDAMYAYMFYRLVQRAKKICFIYNSTEDTGKSGEVSRFIRQLQHEANLSISFTTESSGPTLEDPHEITVVKNNRILHSLYRFTSMRHYEKRFTPTALNTYLDCRLKFYFKYILELYELDEVSEEVDPMVFGNILHHVMEELYLPYDIDGKRTVSEEKIKHIRQQVNVEINKAFARQFGGQEAPFEFEGQNILVREIIRKMILKVLENDARRTPFDILGVEADHEKGYVLNTEIEIVGAQVTVGMKGIIDRIEQKDDTIRIVDYKTGRDDKTFQDIPSLFDRENDTRNKAVFQTLFYGLLYRESPSGNPEAPLQASLYNIRELFNDNYTPLIQVRKGRSKQDVVDIREYLDEYNEQLKHLLQEIFDRDVDFSQTDDSKRCGYCPYVGICNK